MGCDGVCARSGDGLEAIGKIRETGIRILLVRMGRKDEAGIGIALRGRMAEVSQNARWWSEYNPKSPWKFEA